MDYTSSLDHIIHDPTGQRMHSDTLAIPTAVSSNDMNMVIWSLMEILKAGGIAGRAFNPDDPDTYQRLLQAILKVSTGRLLRTTIYIRDAAGVQKVAVDGGAFTAVGATVFNPLAGTAFVDVEAVGGGGGGGGARATTAGQISVGAGGGGGAYGRGRYSKAAATGIAVTVGAAGAGGNGANGAIGGTTSFGPHLSAPGGAGGQTLGPSAPPLYAVCGQSSAASGGYINAGGTRGFTHMGVSEVSTFDGEGGGTYFGGGAARSASTNGYSITTPGAGGGGTSNISNMPVRIGGNGAPGLLIVREYV
ncbi:hypothetical protein EM868_00190 [Cupriavidus gilardii]|uniref:glycine-rich domain-containing protein n=1 Tax=Cupriavidus gilardii TaxID=82541 RepID=UPI001EE4F631|nr:hypothetical protein [Cupriavidus gilardii]MCG5260371.1 hypothetical protein [Cupriavidus gilardii]MDF9428222.1 hypothetical protein [Cupriavidus gilardii]